MCWRAFSGSLMSCCSSAEKSFRMKLWRKEKTTKEETQEWVELLAFQAEVTEQRLRSQVNRGEATMLLASKQWARILVRHGTLFNFSVKSLDTQERPSHADRSGTFELFNSGVPWQRCVIAKALSIGCYMKCHSSNSSWNEKKSSKQLSRLILHFSL